MNKMEILQEDEDCERCPICGARVNGEEICTQKEKPEKKNNEPSWKTIIANLKRRIYD